MPPTDGPTFDELRQALEVQLGRLASPDAAERPTKKELDRLAYRLEERIHLEKPAPPEAERRSAEVRAVLKERRSRFAWAGRKHSFDEVKRLLNDDLQAWRRRRSEWQAEVNELRAVVDRMQTAIEEAFPEGPEEREGQPGPVEEAETTPVRHLSWRLIPKGPLSAEELARHVREAAGHGTPRRVHLERIERLLSLGPTECFVGLDEFRGYVVFCYEGTEIVVLDNPLEGNALYLIRSGWRELSRLAKRELLSEHGSRVRRLVHRGAWFDRLRAELAAARS